MLGLLLFPLTCGQPARAATVLGTPRSSPASDSPLTLSAISTSVYSQFVTGPTKFCYMQGHSLTGRGINIGVINPVTGQKVECRNFDTWLNHDNFHRLVAYIRNSIPDGFIILAAISDEGGFINHRSGNCSKPWGDPRVEDGYWALESLGSTMIREVGFRGTWSMISMKGKGALQEAYHNPALSRDANGYCQLNGRIPPTQVSAVITLTTLTSP